MTRACLIAVRGSSRNSFRSRSSRSRTALPSTEMTSRKPTVRSPVFTSSRSDTSALRLLLFADDRRELTFVFLHVSSGSSHDRRHGVGILRANDWNGREQSKQDTNRTGTRQRHRTDKDHAPGPAATSARSEPWWPRKPDNTRVLLDRLDDVFDDLFRVAEHHHRL